MAFSASCEAGRRFDDCHLNASPVSQVRSILPFYFLLNTFRFTMINTIILIPHWTPLQ